MSHLPADLPLNRLRWPDRAKFVCRARPREPMRDPRHAVPLLQTKQIAKTRNERVRQPSIRESRWALLGAQAGMPVLLKGKRRRLDGQLVVESAAMLDIHLCKNIWKNFERRVAGIVLCFGVACLGATRAEAQTGAAAQGNSSAESGAAAKVEAEIRHEQKYVERETPSDRQFSTVNSETPGTEGKIGNCDSKRPGSSEYRACDLTFLRRGRRESHRVMRPGVFPPTYFSGVHNDWGLWEESKDDRLRYFRLHTDGRVEIGATRMKPHSVH
jgi:hypothetical protein